MSKKLLFQVLHMSGCDDGYHAKELEIHSPTTKGWQSSRFCGYPQEIILCLKDASSISKVQILSHQYNIASKIEMFVALPSTAGVKSLVGCKFKRLGYVHMSTNEGTKYKARELKSVHLNADGQFVKLLIHKNHVNKLNLYNQVCIVAVNILGSSLSQHYGEDINGTTKSNDLISFYMNQSDHVNSESHLNPDPLKYARYDGGKVISPLDDLAFDMYQDPETAQLIRKLEEKKHIAVLEERFDYAKKLKQAMTDLYKVGEKLGRFEVEKRRAVEMENYDLAKSKKIQSDEYRLHVYKQLDVMDLLELNHEEANQKRKKNENFGDDYMPTIAQHKTQQQQQQLQHEEIKFPPVANAQIETTPPKVASSNITTMPNISLGAPLVQEELVERNDDRPLPALKGKRHSTAVEDYDPHVQVDDAALPVLSEKEEREFGLIIDVFGMKMAKQLHSKSWKHREDCLISLNTEIQNPTEWTSEHTPKEISQAVLTVLKKSLQDQVFVVLNDSITLLMSLLSVYIPQHHKSLGKNELNNVLDKLLPVILKRTGDLVPRSRSLMIDTLVHMSANPELKDSGIIQNAVSEPIKARKHAPWRLLKSQIEIMQILIKELGIDKQGGFTTSRVMKVLTASLEHPNNTVRDASMNCILEVYRIIKDPLKLYFPPDEPTTRKNPLYGKLFDGFDRADGKLTESERKLAAKKQKEQEEKNKAEEIKALQEQLQNLRSMASAQIESQSSESNNNNQMKQESKANLKARSSTKKASKETVRRESKLRTPISIKRDSIKPATDKMCIFCGEQSEEFTEEGLDAHYWKSCLMLKRCESCAQVVEISTMREHLVSECEKKSEYMRCKVCNKVVKKTMEKNHLDSGDCKVSDIPEELICPLCQHEVPEGDESWKIHLLENCKPNLDRLRKNKVTKPSKDKITPKRVGRGTSRGRGRSVSKLPTRTPGKKK